MKVSPGCISAMNTAWLAWLPELRLDIGEAAAEQRLGALDRQLLGDVDELAAAVVAAAGIALGIFVGQDRALRLQHGAGDDVLGGDQLDLVALATSSLPMAEKAGGEEAGGRFVHLGRSFIRSPAA
jgi:hypothetical protein